MRGNTSRSPGQERRPPRRDRLDPFPPRKRRANYYKRVQTLYAKDKSFLAGRILDGLRVDAPQTYPDIADVENAYSVIFDSDDRAENVYISDPKPPTEGLYSPIRVDEFKSTLESKMSGAAGPDDIHLGEVRRLSLARLALLLNAMVLFKTTPSGLRPCRTTLIPKSDDNLLRVDSWRSITVEPILVRLLHRVLARRLSALPLHGAQHGF